MARALEKRIKEKKVEVHPDIVDHHAELTSYEHEVFAVGVEKDGIDFNIKPEYKITVTPTLEERFEETPHQYRARSTR